MKFSSTMTKAMSKGKQILQTTKANVANVANPMAQLSQLQLYVLKFKLIATLVVVVAICILLYFFWHKIKLPLRWRIFLNIRISMSVDEYVQEEYHKKIKEALELLATSHNRLYPPDTSGNEIHRHVINQLLINLYKVYNRVMPDGVQEKKSQITNLVDQSNKVLSTYANYNRYTHDLIFPDNDAYQMIRAFLLIQPNLERSVLHYSIPIRYAFSNASITSKDSSPPFTIAHALLYDASSESFATILSSMKTQDILTKEDKEKLRLKKFRFPLPNISSFQTSVYADKAKPINYTSFLATIEANLFTNRNLLCASGSLLELYDAKNLYNYEWTDFVTWLYKTTTSTSTEEPIVKLRSQITTILGFENTPPLPVTSLEKLREIVVFSKENILFQPTAVLQLLRLYVTQMETVPRSLDDAKRLVNVFDYTPSGSTDPCNLPWLRVFYGLDILHTVLSSNLQTRGGEDVAICELMSTIHDTVSMLYYCSLLDITDTARVHDADVVQAISTYQLVILRENLQWIYIKSSYSIASTQDRELVMYAMSLWYLYGTEGVLSGSSGGTMYKSIIYDLANIERALLMVYEHDELYKKQMQHLNTGRDERKLLEHINLMKTAYREDTKCDWKTYVQPSIPKYISSRYKELNTLILHAALMMQCPYNFFPANIARKLC
jgi:hypothetical protein